MDFGDAERKVAAGRPVVGYLGYDHVAVLEPTVPLPEPGPGLPESRFVVADTLVRFDHAASVAEVLAGDPAEVSERLAAGATAALAPVASPGPTQRFPSREAYEEGVRRAKDASTRRPTTSSSSWTGSRSSGRPRRRWSSWRARAPR